MEMNQNLLNFLTWQRLSSFSARFFISCERQVRVERLPIEVNTVVLVANKPDLDHIFRVESRFISAVTGSSRTFHNLFLVPNSEINLVGIVICGFLHG